MKRGIGFACALWLFGVSASHGAGLSAGVAVVDITPPLGFPMSGYYHERGATGSLDPLQAKALFLSDGERSVALVFCDLIGITYDLSTAVRRRASKECGIAEANIVVAATHAHTGPDYDWGPTSPPEREKTGAYMKRLENGIVEAIRKAQGAARPVGASAGAGRLEGVAFNRRFHMKDGTVRFNPGIKNPNILRVAGPVDPAVGILLLRSEGKPFCSVTNFAMHLDTVGGSLYSADYPYFLERSLKRAFGDGFVSLFGTGACGDVNHVNVAGPRAKRGPEGITKEAGEKLGAEVAARIPLLGRVKKPTLAVGREVVRAPLQPVTPERLEWAEGVVARDRAGEKIPFLTEVDAYKVLDLRRLRAKFGETLPLEVQVVALGQEVALVFLPGEVFVDLGLAIKKASPFETTLVVELANSNPVYIPTKKAFVEGSYEVTNSRVQSGSGEMLADAALRLLKDLRGE